MQKQHYWEILWYRKGIEDIARYQNYDDFLRALECFRGDSHVTYLAYREVHFAVDRN